MGLENDLISILLRTTQNLLLALTLPKKKKNHRQELMFIDWEANLDRDEDEDYASIDIRI